VSKRRRLTRRKSVGTCLLSALMLSANGSNATFAQQVLGQPQVYAQPQVQEGFPGSESLIVEAQPSVPSGPGQTVPSGAYQSQFFSASTQSRALAGEPISPGQPLMGLEHLGLPTVIEPPSEAELQLISPDDGRIKTIEPGSPNLPKRLDFFGLSSDRYDVYRSEESAVSYMPGDGDQFGWMSFESTNYLGRKSKRGMTTNFNMHLLSGPIVAPLPPRLYDFELGYQARNSISDLFSYDCTAMVGIYSDFEDSARDGVRFPAHAVGMFHPGPRADFVVGVDYYGRDDIKVLPVGGLVWHDPNRPQWRYQMVFPRPRIDYTLTEQTRLYCAGFLGGGSWDIEFPNNHNDVMTYRDYKLVTGIEHADDDGSTWGWEAGWIFSRKLEFRSLPQDYSFDDAFVIRYVTRR
jgi:hypothetical protein